MPIGEVHGFRQPESKRKRSATKFLSALPLIGKPLTGFDCRHQREPLVARPTKPNALQSGSSSSYNIALHSLTHSAPLCDA
jgi:hypothetical protein